MILWKDEKGLLHIKVPAICVKSDKDTFILKKNRA